MVVHISYAEIQQIRIETLFTLFGCPKMIYLELQLQKCIMYPKLGKKKLMKALFWKSTFLVDNLATNNNHLQNQFERR